MKTIVADKNALRRNLNEVRTLVGSAEIVADLSGDGQGLGLLRMARFLAEEGIQSFAVTEPRDAAALRRGGFTQEHILILRSMTDLQELRELMDCGVTFTVGSVEAGIALNSLASELHTAAEVRICVDAGTGQYGFLSTETEKMLSLYRQMPGIAVTGMYLRESGSRRKKTLEARVHLFESVAQNLQSQGVDTGILMALESVSLFCLDAGRQNAVLVGSALIGRTPCRTDLVRVGTVEATVEELKWLPEGTAAGLGSGRKLRKPARVGVVDLGWANGVGVLRRPELRSLPERLLHFVRGERYEPSVRVNGKRAKVLGTVGMTGFVLDVTKCDCNSGDRAVFEADPRLLRFLPVEMRE